VTRGTEMSSQQQAGQYTEVHCRGVAGHYTPRHAKPRHATLHHHSLQQAFPGSPSWYPGSSTLEATLPCAAACLARCRPRRRRRHSGRGKPDPWWPLSTS
jgi:hypothetical protein